MSFQHFIDRMAAQSHLDEGDIQCLMAITCDRRHLAAGSFATRNGTKPNSCSVLESGVAVNHKIVGHGGRQIVGMILAGEMLDFDGLFLEKIDYNVQAISDCEVAVFPCHDLTQVIFDRPAIGKALFRENAIKAAISREWMANLGRRDSKTKVAHLLCEISTRLQVSGDETDNEFELPINQDQIADIIGVTPMHVGRVLKELEAEKIIAREKRLITLLNLDQLKLMGDFSPEYLQMTWPPDFPPSSIRVRP